MSGEPDRVCVPEITADAVLPRIYIRTPSPIRLSRFRLTLTLAASGVLVPWYWLMALLLRTPGLGFRARCLWLGLRLLVSPHAPFPRVSALGLILMPMDSTRYFEFDYVERATATLPATHYFDVSSPRLVPVMFALSRNDLLVDMINPDPKDLAGSRQLVTAVGLAGRCRLHGCLTVDAPFEPETFDIVSCVSVLEHIPEDSDALRSMWATLKRGGTLVLTVPCMARACEQYIDEDEYGLLPKDQNGYVFWQRFYDSALLDERVFSVVGRPVNIEIYGEKISGSFARNAEQKRRLRRGYPFWREPYMMGREYRFFRTLEELPGDGVIAMTFIKT